MTNLSKFAAFLALTSASAGVARPSADAPGIPKLAGLANGIMPLDTKIRSHWELTGDIRVLNTTIYKYVWNGTHIIDDKDLYVREENGTVYRPVPHPHVPQSPTPDQSPSPTKPVAPAMPPLSQPKTRDQDLEKAGIGAGIAGACLLGGAVLVGLSLKLCGRFSIRTRNNNNDNNDIEMGTDQMINVSDLVGGHNVDNSIKTTPAVVSDLQLHQINNPGVEDFSFAVRLNKATSEDKPIPTALERPASVSGSAPTDIEVMSSTQNPQEARPSPSPSPSPRDSEIIRAGSTLSP